MKKEWMELVTKYTADKELIDKYYDIIEKEYNSSDRHYHNLRHIKLMLSEAKKLEKKFDDFNSICFAIWFHDIVYNHLKSNNEEKSAECAIEFLTKIKYEKYKIKKVNELILRTKDHTIQNGNEDFDTKVFLDLDLLILGTNRDSYIEYTKNIRKEYTDIPDGVYKEARKKFLTNLLNSKIIYKNKKFQQIFEKPAKENIKFELEKLLSN